MRKPSVCYVSPSLSVSEGVKRETAMHEEAKCLLHMSLSLLSLSLSKAVERVTSVHEEAKCLLCLSLSLSLSLSL